MKKAMRLKALYHNRIGLYLSLSDRAAGIKPDIMKLLPLTMDVSFTGKDQPGKASITVKR